MSERIRPVNLEDVRIGFRNFEGKEGRYNKKGERSFAVFLDEQTAEAMAQDGWNIKFPKENPDRVDPDEPARDPYLQVSVVFENYPPNVFIISNGVPTRIGPDEVEMLDWAELEHVDLVLRPYQWVVNGSSGVKAYLKSGYFTIVSDKFAAKYGL
jgi:hypothetical protein